MKDSRDAIFESENTSSWKLVLVGCFGLFVSYNFMQINKLRH